MGTLKGGRGYSYDVVPPRDATADEKALLMASALTLDLSERHGGAAATY